MNTSNLKKYAPKARREFMEAVTRRLNLLGISADKKGHLQISEPVISGSVMQIDGNSFDSQLARPRNRLVERCETLGFHQLVEQVAYTWFNRLCAIRFMELHDYLDHGLRVLSHPASDKGFEILDHAQDAAEELGLDRNHVVELKLAGNKDEQLYRELLLGQCHKLHEAMPFLFEALDDDTELLLPDNLTRTDSILRGLVDSVPEADWQQVEVIGWLYQFYISEKKDQVIGKVVKSEDIPAATQLFTPNWIVKYLVQNSVGRQWLQSYPDSAIKSQMEYYIEPAEQTPEVVEQLKAITPDAIDPETIKVLDPACGSGHILIEAYNVLKAIYEERGFRSRDIPQLILENNLFGLDIDDRAAQLAGFALMMMAREDDKRIFSRNVQLNVLSLQESAGFSKEDLAKQWQALNLSGDWQTGASQGMFSDSQQELSAASADQRFKLLQTTLARFTEAKTFGSLIEVPAEDLDGLKELFATLNELAENGDSMQKSAAKQLLPFVHQAVLLAQRYDAVVANPPYMGNNFFNQILKNLILKNYTSAKLDIYTCFMLAGKMLLKKRGRIAFVTMHTWMYLGNFCKFRERLLNRSDIENLIHMENGIMGISFKTAAFVINNFGVLHSQGKYTQITPEAFEKLPASIDEDSVSRRLEFFSKLPSNEIAFSLTENQIDFFKKHSNLNKILTAREGLTTADNEAFLRYWWEVDHKKIYKGNSHKKWYPYQKGGQARKWYGNNEWIVNWDNDGKEIKNNIDAKTGRVRSHNYNGEYGLRSGITWSSFSNGGLSFRYVDEGYFFDTTGSMAFAEKDVFTILAYLNASSTQNFFKSYSPTPRIKIDSLLSMPFVINKDCLNDLSNTAEEIVRIERELYNSEEVSPSFNLNFSGIKESWEAWREYLRKKKEDKNKLESKIESIVSQNLLVEETYISEVEGEVSTEINILLSYSIGCMMGRYSLDREGLVYAHAANEGFTDLVAEGAYQTFPADDDGIIPLTDQEWFKDDATNRFREFVKTVWGEEHLQENLLFVAESLCLHAIKPLSIKRGGEAALATIRRYLSSQFYKDHLKTYKKRPIYWLFSSGKQKAFECLVYLHRYNEGTLARMRTEYVTPLLGKYDAYLDQLENQIDHASSTAEANRLKKERDALTKKQVELRSFDDKLKHYADRRIALDLDDGVKVNYGKFGDLLSDVKAITGHAPENN